MAKIDPHKHKERYLNWKEKTSDGIPDVSKVNSDIIKQFLKDMEMGLNIANGMQEELPFLDLAYRLSKKFLLNKKPGDYS